jgi:hypothetical protein
VPRFSDPFASEGKAKGAGMLGIFIARSAFSFRRDGGLGCGVALVLANLASIPY